MILEQHYLGCLAQASYLIADPGVGEALVVDPRRDVEVYLERARALGVRISRVLLTHCHADFLAGHLELLQATGATIHMGAAARAEFDFEPLSDGQQLPMGDVLITALATPGHTLESVCYLVHDLAHDAHHPHAILTGDTLFIGDVGRPDLAAQADVSPGDMAGKLYDSLHAKILPLPDETLVYPGHGAGSACGRSMSQERFSSLGVQRRENYALAEMGREEFVAQVTPEQPTVPAYFPRAVRLNKSVHSILGDVLGESLVPMDLEGILQAQAGGAQVLDTRGRDEFAAGHVRGSTWVGLDGNFASWCGSLLDLEAAVVLVAEEGAEREAATRLGRVGIDSVRGYLVDAQGALAPSEPARASVLCISAEEAARELVAEEPPLVLDVRLPGEVSQARIAGSLAVPLAELSGRMHEVPKERRLLVHCKTGYRSMAATSLLLAAGFDAGRVRDVRGGFDAWLAAGLPHEAGSASGDGSRACAGEPA